MNLTTTAAPDATESATLKSTCMVCHVPVPESRQGWGAMCERCQTLLDGGMWSPRVAELREAEIADAAQADWREYAAWSDAMDRAAADDAERREYSATDLAYADGYSLGRDEIAASAPRHLSPLERRAWDRGHFNGRLEASYAPQEWTNAAFGSEGR